MLTGWQQGALWTAALDQKLALKIDRGLLKLIEAFELKLLPNLLLRQHGTLFDDFTLLLVQTVVEPWARCLMVISERLLRSLKSTGLLIIFHT